MATKRDGTRKFKLTDGAILAITNEIGKLLKKHRDKVESAVNDADDLKLPVTFKVEMDAAQSADQFQIDVRYTPETVTDRRVVRADPANEMTFVGMSMEELARAEAKASEAAAEAERASHSGGESPAPKKGRKEK